VNLYDIEKDKYDRNHHFRPYYGWKTKRVKRVYKPFVEALNDSKTALDVGCGKGRFIHQYGIDFPHLKIRGTDISDCAVDSCLKKGFDVVQGSMTKLPFKDNEVDLLYHYDGMEHIPEEWEEAVLREQFRVAGKYVLHTIAGNMDREKLHINLKPSKVWIPLIESIMTDYGFKILHNLSKRNRTILVLKCE